MKDTPEERTRGQWSRRAGILARVLDWVNQEEFEDHDSWMLFGGMRSEQLPDELNPARSDFVLSQETTTPAIEKLLRALGRLAVEGGRVLDSRRTSLAGSRPAGDVRQDWISDVFQQSGLDDLQDIPEADMDHRAELLDAKFSDEIIGKLEKIVQRAALLDPHDVDSAQIRSKNVRGSFEQAH